MELTVRLLVSHALLFAAALLPPSATTTQALEGISSLSSLRGNGRQPLSREEELMKALQFLEEYERNLGDKWDDEGETDWQLQGYPYMQADDLMEEDKDSVPWDEVEEEQDTEHNLDLNLFLRNILQGAYKNRKSATVPKGYYTPQRSSFNNQYVLFSPVDNDADLEDEITLDVAIEKLKARQKEEQLWEDIIGDMLAEEILEMDAREEIQELMDVKEEEEELDAILEGEEESPMSTHTVEQVSLDCNGKKRTFDAFKMVEICELTNGVRRQTINPTDEEIPVICMASQVHC